MKRRWILEVAVCVAAFWLIVPVVGWRVLSGVLLLHFVFAYSPEAP